MRVLARGSLAFFAAESRDLVEIGECPLADETLNQLIRSAAAGELTFSPGTTVLMQLVDGEAVWEVEARGNSRERRGSGKKDSPSVENVIGFHQVNEGVNLLVREKVLEIARRRAGDQQRAGDREHAGDRGLSGSRVLDLYCGNGNLSLPLAEAGAHVAGYDTDGASLEEAKRAYKKTPEGGQLFLKKMDALGAVREVSTGKVRPFGSHSPDLVILDPPRGGVGDEGMKGICGTGAGTILYVSCDPATLSRDLKEAVGQGYRVVEAIPFDMFPQTSHFETLVVLER